MRVMKLNDFMHEKWYRPNSPVGTVHIRLHGARYIEAAKPVVKVSSFSFRKKIHM